ncbi:hypothetical protein, partial [Clostridium puniceum]|uniref:hypothetical protein n=1 Tax=Clostridium puniceum TaxID=29367 RepID=UPI001177E32E
MLEFGVDFPLEELEERVNAGYFDEELYIFLSATLKSDSEDAKKLISGQMTPYKFFSLQIKERDKAWLARYISEEEQEEVSKEVVTLLKNRIDMVFEKVKIDLRINKEVAQEVLAQEQPQVRTYDFEPVINELQEVLVKHRIYLCQFDQITILLKSKIIHDSRIQK